MMGPLVGEKELACFVIYGQQFLPWKLRTGWVAKLDVGLGKDLI